MTNETLENKRHIRRIAWLEREILRLEVLLKEQRSELAKGKENDDI